MKSRIFITLFLLAGITINAQAQYTTVMPGDTVVLTVTGSHGSIQWQQSIDSLTWTDLPGLSDSVVTFVTTSSATGKKYYRAEINDTLCPLVTPFYSSVILHKVISSTAEIEISDWFHGGIVFYTDSTGDGLIAPQQDQGLYPWGCFDTSIPGATSTTHSPIAGPGPS